MGRPISSQVGLEFTAEQGFHNPQTSRRSRAITPVFGTQQFGGTSLTVINTEPVSITLTVGALASGASTAVTATQGFATMASITPAASDLGNILFTAVSVSTLTNLLAGHPSILVVSNQGYPIGGALSPGLKASGLGLQVTLPVYATGTFAGGTVTVTATALLLGTATGNQH